MNDFRNPQIIYARPSATQMSRHGFTIVFSPNLSTGTPDHTTHRLIVYPQICPIHEVIGWGKNDYRMKAVMGAASKWEDWGRMFLFSLLTVIGSEKLRVFRLQGFLTTIFVDPSDGAIPSYRIQVYSPSLLVWLYRSRSFSVYCRHLSGMCFLPLVFGSWLIALKQKATYLPISLPRKQVFSCLLTTRRWFTPSDY